MRNDTNQHQIEFYAKNNNVSLIVMRPEGTDGIIGRALLWTTVDGKKVMDRIYTTDSKLVSLFHRYAAENNFLNIYEYRLTDSGKPNLTAMSPGNWSAGYKENFIVNLNYLTKKIEELSLVEKFNLCKNRQTSINGPYNIPYLDNFCLINTATNQISVLPIDGVFICPLSNQPITFDNYEYIGNVVYNGQFVHRNKNGVAELIPDIISLDANDLFETVKEINDFIESLEEDELENIVTQQITNEQSYGTLDSSVIIRIIEDVTITNNNNV
jgi:hypothetical protein